MKKIMIALAVAALAVASQAASFTWKTANNLNGVDIASLTGNGDYALGANALKGASALAITVALYDGETLVGSYSGDLKFGSTNKKVSTNFTITQAAQNTAYNYILTITGTQNDMTGVIGDWDYTDATMTAQIKGSLTTNASGATTFTTDPTTWTVAGAVEAVPEPTSAMLLLLGMAGLALKRKQA